MAKTEQEYVEQTPAFEIHLGEPSMTMVDRPVGEVGYRRLAIIWINGKRWQGFLTETPEVEDKK